MWKEREESLMNFRLPTPEEYNRKINFSAEQISERIKELGAEISRDYPNGVTLLINQKSSLVFTADLMREISPNVRIEFLRLGSIKQQDDASPLLFLRQSEEIILEGQDCILCTDIVRTGFTMHFLLTHLKSKNPKSLEICTLLHNPEQQLLPFPLKYIGFETDYDSLCGYGISYQSQGRQFKDIVQLVPDEN